MTKFLFEAAMINDEIFTEIALRPLADCWTRSGLIEWLTRAGIPFVVSKNGWPRVHRKALEAAMGVKHADEAAKAEAVEFNFDALR